MANAFKRTTQLWVVDETGELNTGAIWITHIGYTPAANDDDLVLTDTSDNTAIVIKAGLVASGQVNVSFASENSGRGRHLPSLKVATIDGGTAYIYLRSASQ